MPVYPLAALRSTVALALLSGLLLLPGCTTTQTVTLDGSEEAERGRHTSLELLQQSIRGRNVHVQLRNGYSFTAEVAHVDDETIAFVSYSGTVALRDIDRIAVRRDAARGFVEGMSIGALGGFAVGFALGAASYDEPDFFVSSRGESGLLGGILLAMVTTPTGAIVGALRRHKYVYRIRTHGEAVTVVRE